MNYRREAKHVERSIRKIPVDSIAPQLAADEGSDGRYCIVADRLEFVLANGRMTETAWDDPVEVALIGRYVRSIPERIHPTYDSALTWVRSQLSK